MTATITATLTVRLTHPGHLTATHRKAAKAEAMRAGLVQPVAVGVASSSFADPEAREEGGFVTTITFREAAEVLPYPAPMDEPDAVLVLVDALRGVGIDAFRLADPERVVVREGGTTYEVRSTASHVQVVNRNGRASTVRPWPNPILVPALITELLAEARA